MDVSKVFEFSVKEFYRQPRALIGPGAAEMAGGEAATMGLRHVLFVTSGLRGTGIIDEVKRNFEDAGVSVTIYDKVESNPKDYNCMDAYKAYMDSKCDGFVSIGGGSSHDTTKGARIVAAHDGRNVNEFQGVNKSEKLENPPHIAINTTVGTGSETTPGFVITDLSSPKAPHKWVGFDRAATATLAINDPVFMMTQPSDLVAYTGCDTLAHASECYVDRIEHLSATPLSLKAVELVAQNLREATANPRNYEAMANMCWAQYIAAQAFSSGLLGILHSLSHAVCAYYDIHHGLNNGIGLARVWAYNQSAAGRKYADIARAMGVDTRGMSSVQASDAAIDAVIRLVKDIGIPDNFQSVNPKYTNSRMGVGWYASRPTEIKSDEAELRAMAEHMMGDVCTPGNPRTLTLDDAYEILRDCVYDPMRRTTEAGAAYASNGGNGRLASAVAN
jgi:methanol:N,N-dimethyl-4-nitrosoaniline oxidoreductase